MKKLLFNYKGTFIKELRMSSYVIAGLGVLGFIGTLIINSEIWFYGLFILFSCMFTS